MLQRKRLSRMATKSPATFVVYIPRQACDLLIGVLAPLEKSWEKPMADAAAMRRYEEAFQKISHLAKRRRDTVDEEAEMEEDDV